MRNSQSWLRGARDLAGERFAAFQRALAEYNHQRLEPALPDEKWKRTLSFDSKVAEAEIAYIEAARREIAPIAADIPSGVEAFIAWFENLKATGPGQGDPLFPWLATAATEADLRWFMLQEVAGEAGFEDLLAITQVKFPVQAKLEMARNYWDEMGRGGAKGMHGPMLSRLADHFGIAPTPDNVVPESLALGNCMIGLAMHRQYAYHSVGALGVIEMTAPTRAKYVDRGLRRLGVPAKKRHYFALHAVLDVKHSEAWNREVLRSLVSENPASARAIGEGAVLRLWHGARCFERYREHYGLDGAQATAA